MPAAPIEDTTAVSRHPHAIAGELPGETILLRTDTGTSLRLNATAAWIWEQLEDSLPVRELVSRLAAQFPVDETAAAGDVRSFVSDLAAREFLVLG